MKIQIHTAGFITGVETKRWEESSKDNLACDVMQLVKCLPNIHEPLASNPRNPRIGCGFCPITIPEL